MPVYRRAFTLIELLVVVTIIVVLLAMLSPALSRSIYQATLAACGVQQRTIAFGLLSYTTENKQFYPYRGLPGQRNQYQIVPQALTNPYEGANGPGSYDIRPPLRTFLNINKQLRDPFVEAVNLDYIGDGGVNDVYILNSYHLWYGWQYKASNDKPVQNAQGKGIDVHDGMFKRGDRFDWDGNEYNLLVGDPDLVFDGDSRGSSHPDRKYMFNNFGERIPFTGGLITASAWSLFNSLDRGNLDLNFAYDDGSVRRMTNVYPNKDPEPAPTKNPDMTWIPSSYDAINFWGVRSQVPRH